jgi:hypothetical protein
MIIHNEGIFEGPQVLDNNELPDKAYKNSNNGGNMTQNQVSFNWRDINPTLLQTCGNSRTIRLFFPSEIIKTILL